MFSKLPELLFHVIHHPVLPNRIDTFQQTVTDLARELLEDGFRPTDIRNEHSGDSAGGA